MDRAHRQELKHDKFVEQVGHGVGYAVSHKDQFLKFGIALLVLFVVGFGVYFYMQHQESVRGEELRSALRILEAPVGETEMGQISTIKFNTADERSKALDKALRDIIAKYPSKREGYIAKYLLGTNLADRGNLPEAEKLLADVANNASDEYASQAQLSLAQLLSSQGKHAEAEKLLRELVNEPTVMVSKEQATIALAKVIAKTKPDEARKLLEPLRGAERSAVSRNALTAIAEMPAAK